MKTRREQITLIVGLSETRRLPRLGKIRLGIKVKTAQGKEYPKEVEYFVCPPEVRKVYGEKPVELDIMFPVEEVFSFFPQALKWYGSGQGLRCKGNGEMALRRIEDCTEEQKENCVDSDDEMIEISCPCEKLDTKECSKVGNLMVLLPKVSLGGVYQIDTGSASNIVTINSYIDYLRGMTRGRVSLIPLKLRRIKQEMIFKDKDGKSKKSTHFLLQMEMKVTIDEIEQLRRDDSVIVGKMLLPAPVEDGRDYPEVIIDEQKLLDEVIPEPQKKQLPATPTALTFEKAKTRMAELGNLPAMRNWWKKYERNIKMFTPQQQQELRLLGEQAKESYKKSLNEEIIPVEFGDAPEHLLTQAADIASDAGAVDNLMVEVHRLYEKECMAEVDAKRG